jgi:hypothetical protein
LGLNTMENRAVWPNHSLNRTHCGTPQWSS